MNTLKRTGLWLVLGAACAAPASAQTDVNWYVFAAGGGRAGDGVTTIEGSFAQTAVVGTTMTTTNSAVFCPITTRLAPGFWHPDRTVCPADYDQSGQRTIDDIFIYLSDWFAGSLTTDVDCNGQRTIDDIFVFLSLWFAGCP